VFVDGAAARGRALVAGLAVVASAGCGGDAVLLEVEGDLPVGAGVDAMCLAVADRAASGGHFGQVYPLSELPQTLRVEPGAATEAEAWVIGYRAGVPIARDTAAIDFGGDVTLRLDACYPNAGGAAAARGDAVGPDAPAAIVAIRGRGGGRVVAIGSGASAVIDADAGAGELVVAAAGPAPPAGTVRGAIAFDADGDCDDDVVVVTTGAAPAVWRAEGDALEADGAIGTAAVRAAAAADVDRDGDVDVITASGSTLLLHENDGRGRFTADPSAITGAGFVTDATALAFGDLDGDGSVDLVVGQAAGPLRAFAGAPGGGGTFTGAPGVLPDVAVAARALRLADVDGDHLPDLWVAVEAGPARLFVDRAGTLEDQSFIRLPQPAPVAAGIAVGGWDDDCTVDAVIAAPGGVALWRGDGTGALVADGTAGGATAAELVDLDDDGDLDVALATAAGVVWLAR
jgi:hypothetical protein